MLVYPGFFFFCRVIFFASTRFNWLVILVLDLNHLPWLPWKDGFHVIINNARIGTQKMYLKENVSCVSRSSIHQSSLRNAWISNNWLNSVVVDDVVVFVASFLFCKSMLWRRVENSLLSHQDMKYSISSFISKNTIFNFEPCTVYTVHTRTRLGGVAESMDDVPAARCLPEARRKNLHTRFVETHIRTHFGSSSSIDGGVINTNIELTDLGNGSDIVLMNKLKWKCWMGS